MIRLLYWLMPVKTPSGWTLALTQEGVNGVQPIVGLVNFEDREELPGVAQMLYAYVMKLHGEWESVVRDPEDPEIPQGKTDIPEYLLKWEEDNEVSTED